MVGFAVALGAAAVVAQSLWVRELSLLWFGSELCWGMTLAAWLAGVAAGAAAGGAAVSRVRPAYLAAGGAVALAATLPAGLWLLRSARGLLAPGPGEFIPLPQMLGLTAAVAGTTGLWVGALFPAGCSLAVGGAATGSDAPFGSTRRTIGVFFLAEALGTLVGGACFTFWWVERIDAFSLAAGLSAALLLALSAALVPRRGAGRACGAAAGAAALALAGACLLGGFAAADRATNERRWADLVAGWHHVAGRESPFSRIDLGRMHEQWTLYLNCQPAGTFPNRFAVAPWVHLAAAECPALGRALLIGQATGELAAELRSFPGLSVEAVELDPRVQEVLAAHLRPPPPAPTHFADGRHYLKAAGGSYDLILLATPDPTSIATARFYSRDFFREVRGRLAPKGVLAFALAGPAEKISPQLADYLGTIYHAAEEVFPQTLWTWGDPAYIFAAASEGALSFDPAELIRRWNRHRGGPAGTAGGGEGARGGFAFDPLYFESWREDRLQPARLAEFRRVLSGTPAGRVNSDDCPIAMFLSMLRHEATLLSTMAGPAGAKRRSLLALLGGVRADHALGAVGLLAAAVWSSSAVGRLRRRFRSAAAALPASGRGAGNLAVLFSLLTTGAAGMGLNIILLAAFQNLYGYVYSHIALIVAVYMAGVAAGSLYHSRRSFPPYSAAWQRLMLLDAALLAGCLALPAVLWLLARMPGTQLGLAVTEAAILTALAAAGVAGGMAVPLAAGLYRRRARRGPGPGASAPAATGAGAPADDQGNGAWEHEPYQSADAAGTGKVAGAVDAADCLGGAIGALAAGLVLLPLLGWTFTAALLAALKLTSLGALILSRPLDNA